MCLFIRNLIERFEILIGNTQLRCAFAVCFFAKQRGRYLLSNTLEFQEGMVKLAIFQLFHMGQKPREDIC